MKKIFIFIGVLSLCVCVAFAATTGVNEAVSYIYVDVKGEVVNPGVYRVSNSCRVFQVIEIAGGLTDNSITDDVNLASKITDEQVIVIPSEKAEKSDLININTANIADLDSLPEIGYSTAQAIVEYRTANGKFSSIEDIKKVSGIGNATYEKIKDLITV